LKIKISLGFLILGCSAIWAADTITRLDVKLGQWETTSTVQTSGMPPIPQEMLDKMTPDQRAMIEARMKANQTPKTTVTKNCLKKEDLDKALNFGAEDKTCTRTIVTSSSSKQEIKIECNRDNAKSTGMIRIEAAGSDSVKGSVQMAMATGRGTMNINSTFTSKYLGPICSESKDDK
jgi:uncharacterized protein DUF3617